MDAEQGNNSGIGYGKPPAGRPFPPGVSGNPKGRPPKPEFDVLVREFLEDNTINGKIIPGGRTKAMLLIESWYREAIKGKLPHGKELVDRGYGPVAVKHEVTGADGGPIEYEDVTKKTDAELHAIVNGTGRG